MSWLSSLFGGGQAKIVPPADAMEKLHGVEEMLTKEQQSLEKEIGIQREIVKMHASTNEKGEIRLVILENHRILAPIIALGLGAIREMIWNSTHEFHFQTLWPP